MSSKPEQPRDAPAHLTERGSGAVLDAARPGPVAPADDLPVVARLVVEIRSDGRRTIARGALEDVAGGQRVAVEARGSSPLGLALGLARSILSLPVVARASARKLLGGRGPRRGRALPED